MKNTLLTSFLASALLLSSCSQISKEEIVDRATNAAIRGAITLVIPITPQQEAQIGEATKAQIFQQMKPYTQTPALVSYVQGIGNRLAQRAKRRSEVNYQFYVVDSPDVNAFAIPGGGVFVTTEALKYMRNEAELAAVIGHEIGHVDENHGTESIKRAMLLQNVAEGALSNNDPQLVKLLASIVLDLTLKGFSREQEREADRVGVELAVAQSYAPSGLTGFLNTLLQLSGGDPDGLWTFVATHPGSAERIGLLNTYIREKGLQPANPVLNEAQYLRQIAVLPPKLKKTK